ncbi:hypothetical protein BCR36DRAFT_316200 [Piromyces finnis]|uniref:Sorting nexin MVP1 n=1 Tax=Piromyces finnis TaxID=1754191 RepID=A0A1Y1VNM5_9FUNG|nr:hypothetical protein BCR36DRAFT_316200 [Piromyces finnis]|eukprot:ORX59970.1 hypothetical protein BCR36DRAFT_316200 [Piromyces finnis]
MEEEENPFRIDKPNINPLVPDLNSSILSAERQKSNITSNPWEISDGDDILKSIMDIKNKKPSTPDINDEMFSPMKSNNEIKFNNDFGTSSTPNFKVNDPWAIPPTISNSVYDTYDTSNKSKSNYDSSTSLNINTSNDLNESNSMNNELSNDKRTNSDMLTSGVTNTSQPSIKSPINYMNNTQSLVATTSYLNSNDSDSDVITVRISPEKSGIVFKHVNYLIHSKLHKLSSIRRYSDFLWLHEVLCKRYQFRIMISVPPKHIGKLASSNDLAFLEKRRRGLSRFINYVGNHPIMKNDEFYKKFLNKDVDIYHLRKNENIEVSEEFDITFITSEQTNSIPLDFEKNLTNLRSGLNFLMDQYQSLYVSMEKISKNIESSSNEYTNIGYSLGQMSEFKDFLGFDSYNFKLLYNGYARLADGFQKISSILHENHQETLFGIVECIQTQKEIIEGFDNLLQTKDTMINKINGSLVQIDKRIKVTMERLLDNNIRDKEKEKLEILVTQDQQDKSTMERKLKFIKYCIFSEANFLEAQKIQIANMYSEYIQLQMRIVSMLHDEWKLLSVTASKLPVGTF